MTRRGIVRKFVAGGLGCKCPDEVFDEIEITPDAALAEGADLINRMVIGNRLLIYLIETESKEMIGASLTRLVRQGMMERDTSGLNRLRIVIITQCCEELGEFSRVIFSGLRDKDDRVHLHLIDKKSLSEDELCCLRLRSPS